MLAQTIYVILSPPIANRTNASDVIPLASLSKHGKQDAEPFERTLPLPQTEPVAADPAQQGRLRRATISPSSVDKHVIKGSMAKVVNSNTPNTFQRLLKWMVWVLTKAPSRPASRSLDLFTGPRADFSCEIMLTDTYIVGLCYVSLFNWQLLSVVFTYLCIHSLPHSSRLFILL